MYSPREKKLKRAFDVATAAAGLVAAAPVLATAAVLVRMSSRGPIVFRQSRVGRNGQRFELLKFRTMRPAAGGSLITAKGDSRITGVGRFLRRTKVDELPQLWNVLRGELTLVGPRPEVQRYVDLYAPEDRAFLQQFQPGLTDPATVRLRDEETILSQSADPEKLYIETLLPLKVRVYREYLESASFVSDLRVLADTAAVIFWPGFAARLGRIELPSAVKAAKTGDAGV